MYLKNLIIDNKLQIIIIIDYKNLIIDLVLRIELTRAISMPRFSNFLRNSTIYFRMFIYLVTCFLGVTVSLLCRSQRRIIRLPSLIR